MNLSIRFCNLLRICSFAIVIAGSTGCGSGGGSYALVASVNKTAGDVTTSGASSGVGACRGTSYLPNYANGIDPADGLPNRLYHWQQFPVTIYIQSSSYTTPMLLQQIETGFNWWVNSTSGLVSYQIVNNPAQADITVQFEAKGMTGYGALTSYSVDGSGNILPGATITFNMTYLSQVADITPVAAHEFGHALGIAGHSDQATDVMFDGPSTYSLTGLSNRDVNTLLTAYCGVARSVPVSPGVLTEQCKIIKN